MNSIYRRLEYFFILYFSYLILDLPPKMKNNLSFGMKLAYINLLEIKKISKKFS